MRNEETQDPHVQQDPTGCNESTDDAHHPSDTPGSDVPKWRIVEASYLTSAVQLKDCPESDLPEVAIVGRSNVGKSSLINLLCNQKNLAKTSSTPGKTRMINYFHTRIKPGDHLFHIVDLPGYGFAKTSKTEQEHWGRAMQEYLEERALLAGIVHLIDSRHPPTKLDLQMREWIVYSGLPNITALTKADKLKSSQREKNVEIIKTDLHLPPKPDPILCSTTKRNGIAELTAAMVGLVVQFSTE